MANSPTTTYYNITVNSMPFRSIHAGSINPYNNREIIYMNNVPIISFQLVRAVYVRARWIISVGMNTVTGFEI